MSRIRKFEENDWECVKQIYQQGMDTNNATFEITCPTYEEWDRSHMNVCRLVYEKEDRIKGFVALTPVSNRCVYAGVADVSIYIENSATGQGIGKALMKELIIQSEQNDIWTLQSSIMQNNRASIALHKSCGFREIGYREQIGKDRFGVWRNTVLMERRSNNFK